MTPTREIPGLLQLILQLERWTFFLLGLVVLALCIWALVHASKSHAQNFVVSGKKTKNFWLALLGGATAVTALVQITPLIPFATLFQVLAACAAGVYLADVKPEVSGPKQTGYYGF